MHKMLHTTFLSNLIIWSILKVGCDEIFKQDLGDDMQIGIPDGGYKSVKLKCGSNSMHVDLVTEEDFSGVIYTRGSFHEKQQPCYLDPGYKRGQRAFSIHFPLDKCKTLQDGHVYSNVLVVQNDKDLIMPGDAAFQLECDFRETRNITLEAKLAKGSSVVSKITMTNPDQGSKNNSRQKRAIADGDTVEFEMTP